MARTHKTARAHRAGSRSVAQRGLKKMLLAKRAQLLAKLREEMASRREGNAGIDGKKGSLSLSDRLPLGHDEEIEYAVVDRRAEMLTQIEMALKKMEEGTYGRCEACEGEIKPARLKAHPFAVRCTACQEAWERERQIAASGVALLPGPEES